MASGVLRRGREGEGPLVIQSGEVRTPVVLLAQHQLDVAGALVAGVDGGPLIWDGDWVRLVGGFAPTDDPRYPAFLAGSVILAESEQGSTPPGLT